MSNESSQQKWAPAVAVSTDTVSHLRCNLPPEMADQIWNAFGERQSSFRTGETPPGVYAMPEFNGDRWTIHLLIDRQQIAERAAGDPLSTATAGRGNA